MQEGVEKKRDRDRDRQRQRQRETERKLAIENWPEWDFNPQPLNSVHTL